MNASALVGINGITRDVIASTSQLTIIQTHFTMSQLTLKLCAAETVSQCNRISNEDAQRLFTPSYTYISSFQILFIITC
jgi:hypothetical protein